MAPTGRVQQGHYEHPEFLESLGPVLEELKAKVDAPYDVKQLAQLLAQFLQFQEDALGIRSIQAQFKRFPKIPVELLHDTSRSGPIYHLGAICHQARLRNPNIKRVELTNPAQRAQSISILQSFRSSLIREGLLKYPRVFVQPNCNSITGTNVAELQRIVTDLSGEVIQSESQAGITHIVYPYEDGDPDDGNEYLRVQKLRGKEAYVHWWYSPNSYNEWIPQDQAAEKLETDQPARGPRKVYFRWLKDSKKYNEWMNAIDYETDEGAAEQEQRAAEAQAAEAEAAKDEVGGKRKLEDAAMEAAKRPRTDGQPPFLPGLVPAYAPRPTVPPLPPPFSQQVAPGVVRHFNIQPNHKMIPDAMSMMVEHISSGQHSFQRGAPPSFELPPVTKEAKELGHEDYCIPAHATWYHSDRIHDVERHSLPEFFRAASGPRSAEGYRDLRNAIIELYRENCSHNLTASRCRTALTGDMAAISQLHAFLEHWGLINFQAEQDAAGRPVDEIFDFVPVQHLDGLRAAATGAHEHANLVTRRDRMGTQKNVPASEQQARYVCWATGQDCTRLRFHCLLRPDIDLSPQAFADGKLPPGLLAQHFVRLDQAEIQSAAAEWTESETLLLLEAQERYGDSNWGRIAAHVRSKNELQCVVHFLQLPIDDVLLMDAMEVSQLAAPGVQLPEEQAGPRDAVAAAEQAVGVQEGLGMPFAESGNPVMALEAFLTAIMGGRVAAAAALRAAEVIADAAAPGDLDSEPGSEGECPIPHGTLRLAAAEGLKAAAIKARMEASYAERDVVRFACSAIDLQMKRIELKLKQADQLEALLQQQRVSLESQRKGAQADFLKKQEQAHLAKYAGKKKPAQR